MGIQFSPGRRRVFHKLTEPLQNCGTNHHERRHRDLPVPRGSGVSPDGGQVRSVSSVLGGNLRRTLFSRSTGRGSCRFSFTVFGRAIAPSGRGGAADSHVWSSTRSHLGRISPLSPPTGVGRMARVVQIRFDQDSVRSSAPVESHDD